MLIKLIIPLIFGEEDTGRDYLFAPVDMKIVALSGIGEEGVSNKIFLESTSPVMNPKFGVVKIFMTACILKMKMLTNSI